MTATISEDYNSRPFTLGMSAGRELSFTVQGTQDEAAVKTILLATAPAAYQGLEIDSIEAEPLGNGIWKAHARYIRFVSDDEYTFDTGGGTTKITQSLGTINSYSAGYGTPPDFQGAIGVSEDSVEGVDITSPQFEFSETHRFTDVFVLAGYKATLFALTGTVNNATFKGLATGECLFLGASGTKRGDEQWAITFRFAGSPNVSGLTIGDITGITKAGWDYLWVRYADYEDSIGLAIVKRPFAAYVERVYKRTDFSLLTIGT